AAAGVEILSLHDALPISGAGIERSLSRQFQPLEDALLSMGVVVWPMVELEADDALASAAHLAAADPNVMKVCIWTPDKDLAQCRSEEHTSELQSQSNLVC